MRRDRLLAKIHGQRRGSKEVRVDEWVSPDFADEHGLVRAGKLLEWMDVLGVLVASRHCRMTVATASIDGLELLVPIRVGDKVAIRAHVAHTSDRSVGLSVSMWSGPPTRPAVRSMTGYMTFVAIGEQGQVAGVPVFEPLTVDERARHREGEMRREFRKRLDSLGAFEFSWASDHATEVHKIEPVRAGKLNFHGTLYGGTLMRWMETAANLSARTHLGGPVRLRGLLGLAFLRPIAPNTFVHVRSAVVHTSPETATTFVDVAAEDVLDGHVEDKLRAFLTFAPVDHGMPVSPIACDSVAQRRLFEEVELRLAHERELAQWRPSITRRHDPP